MYVPHPVVGALDKNPPQGVMLNVINLYAGTITYDKILTKNKL